MLDHAVTIVHGLLLLCLPALLLGLLLEQRADADAARFRAEMPAEGVGASKAAAATPVIIVLEDAAADKLLLSAVEALVPLAIVLAGKGFAADGADKGTLVRVSSQMGAQVVGAREALGAEGALEGCRMFLRALGTVVLRARRVNRARPRWIGKVEDVVAMRHARRRGATIRLGRGRRARLVGGSIGRETVGIKVVAGAAVCRRARPRWNER